MKLLDFGLAKCESADAALGGRRERPHLTERGTMVGTVPYMAPEQIEGQEVDARTDIFSFGMVLYEMIPARRPFSGDSRAVADGRDRQRRAAPLSSVRPATPPALERLVDRCLAKDPDDRWQTARDLAAELRWIGESGGSAPAPGCAVAHRRAARGLLPCSSRPPGVVALAPRGCGSVAQPSPDYQPCDVPARRRVVRAVHAGRPNFVYSASWEGVPYEVFLGRAE